MQVKKTVTLYELANLVQGEVSGNGEVVIEGVADPATATPFDITFIAKRKMLEQLATTKAGAAILPKDAPEVFIPAIRVSDPVLAVAVIHNHLLARPFEATGVDPHACIGNDCRIPAEVSIGPLVVIGDRVVLGSRVVIYPGVVIGDDVAIGDDTVLHANVSVRERCRIGSRVIIHNGAVIGSDGFGYATDPRGVHVKRPHIGIVQLDDDVEIGANTCVDRATFGKTWVRRGSKLDNLIQIGHNVEIGEGSLLAGQAGVAGSVVLGRGVVLGGQVAVKDHVSLGDRVMVAGQSGVIGDVEKGQVMAGYPAIPHRQWLRASALYNRLPDLAKDIEVLKKNIEELSRRLAEQEGAEGCGCED